MPEIMKDFIVIEGCDGVGKTTIVNKLKAIGYQTLHFGFDPALSIKQKYERLLASGYNSPIVFDRSFISEMVYGPLNRGGSRLSDVDFNELLSLISRRNGHIVYLRADPKSIFQRISDRGNKDKNELDIDKIKQICAQYDKVIDSISNCNVIKIDNTNLSPDITMERIQKSDIDCLIFDFDETLYSPYTCKLADQILSRMVGFIMSHFNLPYAPARKISGDYRKKYGSTVNGLRDDHNIPPEVFLEYSYNMDLSELTINERLRDNLAKIPERKVVLSNASEKYIDKSLQLIGIRDYFSDIVGIYTTNITPKPPPGSLGKVLEITKADPSKCVFFDDQIANIKMAKSFGMKTVLCHKTEDLTGVADFVTNDLAADVVQIVSKIRGKQL
jgi:putative hydrolase of the HAD superfamily